MKTISIGTHKIPFLCGEGSYGAISDVFAQDAPDLFFVVSDTTVWSLHGQRLLDCLPSGTRHEIGLIENGEISKKLPVIERLCETAIDLGASRRSAIVAFGGGVVGNVSGLVASLLFRGVRFVHLPTTLLAACDSVISLKQAVNSRKAKNAFGSYHAPSGILVDPHVLTTLPDPEVRSGIGELAKNALSLVPGHITQLSQIIEREPTLTLASWKRLVLLGLETKLAMLHADPHERAEALVFEYGHTVGHALELADFHLRGAGGIRHGAAVAVGTLAAARVSEMLGVAAPGLAARHEIFLNRMRLPTTMPSGVGVDDVISYVLKDNKRGRLPTPPDHVPMVLLEHEGKVAGAPGLPLVPVPTTIVASAVASLYNTL